MANLIPTELRKEIRNEYRLRVVVVGLYLFAVGALILALLALPTIVLIASQRSAVSEQREILEDTKTSTAEIVTNTNQLLTLIENDRAQKLTPLISRVFDAANEAITFSEVSIEQNDEGVVLPIAVTGSAATRDALTAFRDALLTEDVFATVELPIESLANESNLPFTITIEVTK